MNIINLLQGVLNHPYNKGRKLSALARFARWQMLCRLAPDDIVWPWIGNSKFYARRGESGVTGNIYNVLHEYADMSFVKDTLNKNELFVDIGANVGIYTILAGSVVGADCIAIEPVPATFNRLEQNIRLNHIDNTVEALNIGAGKENTTLKFTAGLDTINHILADDEECSDTVTVPVRSLDDILSGKSPAMMKIDVEGFETMVLEGGPNTFQNKTLKSVIMELNGSGKRYGFSDENLVAIMRDFGFKLCNYNPETRQVREVSLQEVHDNAIFCRKK